MILSDFSLSILVPETFEPWPERFCMTLYESMHTMGAADYIENTLKRRMINLMAQLKSSPDFKSPCVVALNRSFISYKIRESDYDYERYAITDDFLVGNKDMVSWLDDVTVAGYIFIADSKEECMKTLSSFGGAPGIANGTSKVNNPKSFLLTMYSAYYDGKNLGFLGTDCNFTTVVYHEMMHAYQKVKSDNKVRAINVMNDDTCSMITGNYAFKQKSGVPISDNEKGFADLVQIIYRLSPREKTAFVAQERDKFSKADIRSRDEFYDMLNSSDAMYSVKLTNQCIEFLSNYKQELPGDDRILAHLICLYTLDDKSKDIHSLIYKFITRIREEADDIKRMVYNVAYDSLDDKVKNKILLH